MVTMSEAQVGASCQETACTQNYTNLMVSNDGGRHRALVCSDGHKLDIMTKGVYLPTADKLDTPADPYDSDKPVDKSVKMTDYSHTVQDRLNQFKSQFGDCDAYKDLINRLLELMQEAELSMCMHPDIFVLPDDSSVAYCNLCKRKLAWKGAADGWKLYNEPRALILDSVFRQKRKSMM
jgi:hypothetical protein